MLLDFLAGKISADHLTKWAKCICLRPEYGSEFENVHQSVIEKWFDTVT